jgi:hypothetical protein
VAGREGNRRGNAVALDYCDHRPWRSHTGRTGRALVLLAVLATVFSSSGVTWEGEGGASLYVQGAYNDFAMGLWGPSGFKGHPNLKPGAEGPADTDGSATEVPSPDGND